MSTHTLQNLNKPNKSTARTKPFLPVRYSPGENAPKLQLGWDDESFLIVNNEGKLVNKKEDCDGIEVPTGVEVEVVEIVSGLTGIWYGFVFDSSAVSIGKINLWTADETKVLYARPHYFAKQEDVLDLPISRNLTRKDASESNFPEGTKLISPGSNLNWKKLDKYDVRLAYFNFNEFNRKNIPEDIFFINKETIGHSPSLRYSEGLYYFIADDGQRKTTEELGVVGEEEEVQEAAKKEEAQISIGQIKAKAYDALLRYLDKSVEETALYSVLKEKYFANVSEHVTTSSPSPNNQKVLFAIPASYIDGLPPSDLDYRSNFDEGHEPDAPFVRGRNYAFFIKLKDLEDQVDDLVGVFEDIKSKIEEFKQSGGFIKNPNNIDFDVDQQIEAFKAFPEIINEFLTRQSAMYTTDNDFIAQAAAEGTDTGEDHIIQIGLRDNGIVGGNVRETISYIIFSPDNKYLSEIDDTNLFELDPWLTKEEVEGAKDPKRSGVDLRKGLIWLRSKFEGTQGTRTLHYLMAQKSIVNFGDKAGSGAELNEWMKFLQSYSVPPFLIQLTKDKRREEEAEEYDCVKLIEEFIKKKSPLTAKERNKQQMVLNSPKCREAWKKAKKKDTSTMDSFFSKQRIIGSSKTVGNISRNAGVDPLKILYQSLLANLNPKALLALLMTCLQSRLGIPLTAEALCEAAITKIAGSAGPKEFTNIIVTAFPELEPELGEYAVQSEIDSPRASIDSSGERTVVDFGGSPIAAATYLRTADLAVASSIREMEQSGVSIDLTPGTFTDAFTGGQKPFIKIDLDTLTRNYQELGYSKEEADALLVKDGYLRPNQVQYQDNSDKWIFSETNDSYDSSLYGKVQNAGKFVQFLISRVGLQALCEGIVGPLLDMPGDFLEDPEGFIDKERRSPDENLPLISLPDSLSTDDLIGDYGKHLLEVFLAMLGAMLGQILGILLQELLESCFEENTDLGPAGRPKNLRSLPIPSADLQAALDSIGSIGDLPLSAIKEWLKDLVDSLSPSQICALLRGNASTLTLSLCLDRTRLNHPEIYDAGVQSGVDITTIFKKVGESINLDICDAIGVTLPSTIDACDATYDYDARCAELQATGLTKEECDKQIKRELEDLKNKIIGLAGWLFPDMNPLDGMLAEPCGPQGFFVLPLALQDSMRRLTDVVLDNIKFNLLQDLQALKFFSLPPRAILASTDVNEMENAIQTLTDQVSHEQKHAFSMFYIGGGDQSFGNGIGGYTTTEDDYHMCYSATRHFLPPETDFREEFKDFHANTPAGPKGDMGIRTHKKTKPLTLTNYGPDGGMFFQDLMLGFYDFPEVGIADEIKKVIVELGYGASSSLTALESFEEAQGRLDAAQEVYDEAYWDWYSVNITRELLEEMRDLFINSEEGLLHEAGQRFLNNIDPSSGGLAGRTGLSVMLIYGLSYWNPLYLVNLVAGWWDALEGAWQDLRSLVDSDFRARNLYREKLFRIDVAKRDLQPPIDVLLGKELVLLTSMHTKTAELDAAKATFQVFVDKIVPEIKKRVENIPMPMNVEKFLFTTELFELWLRRGFHYDPGDSEAGEDIMLKIDPEEGDLTYSTGAPATAGIFPFGIGYECLDPLAGNIDLEQPKVESHRKPFNLHHRLTNNIYFPLLGAPPSNPADHHRGGLNGIVAYDNSDARWRHMFRMFTGIKEPAHLWTSTTAVASGPGESTKGLGIGLNWAVHPGDRLCQISPGIKYLAELADNDNMNKKHNIFEAFVHLGFAEACGLTRKRVRALYPKLTGGANAIEGVICQYTDYTFPHLLTADILVEITDVHKLVQMLFQDDRISAWADRLGENYTQEHTESRAKRQYYLASSALEWPKDAKTPPEVLRFLVKRTASELDALVAGFGLASDLELREEEDLESKIEEATDALQAWDLNALDPYVLEGAIQVLPLTISGTDIHAADDALWGEDSESRGYGRWMPGYVPVFGVIKKYVRDPDNPWEQNVNDLVCATSLDDRKVNPELHAYLSDDSIIPEVFDNRSDDNLLTLLRQASNKLNSASYLNFNPSFLRYDLPLTEVISSNTKARDQVKGIFEIFKNAQIGTAGGPEIAAALDKLPTITLNNSLMYQNTLTPLESTNKVQENNLKDVSKLVKGKISPEHHPNTGELGVSRGLDLDSWISEGIYNFNFQTDYDSDIQELLSNIGLNSSKDITTLLSDKKISSLVENNSKAVIFSQLLTYKLKNLLNQYSNEENTSPATAKEDLLKHVSTILSSHGYTSLQFAYSNQMFIKLKNSRLQCRRYLKKLWNKILKTPLEDFLDDTGIGCTEEFNQHPETRRTETDFFDLDVVKPKIMEFYKNSICRDVYDDSPSGQNAVKNSLVEGCIILLVKIFTLEMCLASVISWDSFDVGDIFNDQTMVKIIVANMKKEITDFENLIGYANDIVKKRENIEDHETFLLLNKISSIEYLIGKESENISKIIKSMFNNSEPLGTELDLDITLSSDEKAYWTPEEKILYKTIADFTDHEYIVDARLTNNIYTMNYSAGEQTPGKFNHKNNMEAKAEAYWKHHSQTTDLFGMRKKTKNNEPPIQKLSLYSLPMTYHGNEELTDSVWPNKWEMNDPGQPNVVREEYKEYEDNYHLPASKLGIARDNQNCYEMLFSNAINRKLGNITFEPYVKIVDATAADLKGLSVDAQDIPDDPLDPCDALEVLQIPLDLPLPFLGYYRNENNVFGCKIFGYVPLDVWSYFYNFVFLKKVMSNSTYKKVFEKYGIKPFFKEIKFGIRMVYSATGIDRNDNGELSSLVGSYAGVHAGDAYNELPLATFDSEKLQSIEDLVGSENLKRVKSIYNFRRSTNRAEKLTYKRSDNGHTIATVVDGVITWADQDAAHWTSNIITQQATFQECEDVTSEEVVDTVSMNIGGEEWDSQVTVTTTEEKCLTKFTELGELWNNTDPAFLDILVDNDELKRQSSLTGFKTRPELQIPIIEVEKNLDLLPGGFKFDDGDLIPYEEMGYYSANSPKIKDFVSDIDSPTYIKDIADLVEVVDDKLVYGETIKSVINNPTQFFYKNLANDLLSEMKETPEFRLMFDHLFPMRRYMTLAFMYAGDGLSKFIPEPTEILDETKKAILNTLKSLFESGDFVYDPDQGQEYLQNAMTFGAKFGTRGKSPDTTKMILKIILMTPLLILKGFVEITDPAIMTAKAIIDISVAITSAVISGVEQGLRASKNVAESAKANADMALSQAAIAAKVAATPALAAWNKLAKDTKNHFTPGSDPKLEQEVMLPPSTTMGEEGAEASVLQEALEGQGTDEPGQSCGDDGAAPCCGDEGATCLVLEGEPDTWKLPLEKTMAPPPGTTEAGDEPEDLQPEQGLSDPEQAKKDAFLEILDELLDAQETYIAAKNVSEAAGDELDSVRDQLDNAVKEAKKIVSAAQSPYALPAVWASLVPCTIPLLGGLSPLGGPSGTIPGMVYLALMFLDLYEERQALDMQLSEEEDCDDQL